MKSDSLADRIRAVVAAIPRGRVMTYGQVAARAGAPRAARAVGAVMAHNQRPDLVPCHRVVRADGGLAPGFASGLGPAEQARRLAREGVRCGPDGRVDLARFGAV